MSLLEVLAPHSSREEWMTAALALLVACLLLLATRVIAPPNTRVSSALALLLLLASALAFVARQLVSWPSARSLFGGMAFFLYALALGRFLFVFAFDALIARSRREPLPRILRDITQGVLFFVAALLALHAAGVEPGQLLTTSALLTVVAGMALQETLGNLVAGLALQGERPFDVGDWIEVHGTPSHIGRVREINWRATRLHTLDNVDVIVPNGLLAKATVTNYDRPHRAARRSIYFHVPYAVPPRRVHEVVVPAVSGATGVLATPAPSLVTFGFDESGVSYWLRFYIDEMARRDAIDGAVRDRVWYSLERAGVALGVPARNIAMEEISEESERSRYEKKVAMRITEIAQIDLFSRLSAEDVRRLAEHARSELYAPGEVVIRRGDRGETMFVVLSGELRVHLEANGVGATEEVKISRGSFFGEMSLLTGDPRTATVVAQTPSELLVLDHLAFKQLFANHPEVAKAISEKVIERRRNMAARRVTELPSTAIDQDSETRDLFARIKDFFAF